MRVKQASDNGNVAAVREVSSHRNLNNKSWLSLNNSKLDNVYSIDATDNLHYNTNYNIYHSSESADTLESDSGTIGSYKKYGVDVSLEEVCNVQYRLNTQNNINFLKSRNNTQTTNLEAATETIFAPRETFLAGTNVSASSTPIDDERVFELSDTDEMSDRGRPRLPRGIVNPNYPGFQHLAHTLQDYSSNIENFYHSENEMTDDDVDIDITETSYEPEPKLSETPIEYKYINNNNNNNTDVVSGETLFNLESNLFARAKLLDSHNQNNIPDLLKTVSKNNNNNSSTDLDICLDADLENNFHTKDIIGDFNKEIEDEIKLLLNYNINIQDDLEELRKDIKDTFSKPIENTINNISDVVNHVIKKLVETHDVTEQAENNTTAVNNADKLLDEESNDVNKENEANAKTEMNLSRPTFLLIENNSDAMMTDAFLSDGKDEININENEYDTVLMTNNVERTIKQLSTELRKIIPKLDEMREQEKAWTGSIEQQSDVIDIDGNSNQISSNNTEKIAEVSRTSANDLNGEAQITKVKRQNDTSTRKKKPKRETPTGSQSAQCNTSVRRNESIRECDLESFDVYNIETALPKLDIDAIENHLKAAKEAERRKRNDREEIRKRLAMGADSEDYYSMGHTERPGKKPSLQSRLQNGMNLQICFMNETASDNESQSSDVEKNTNNSSKSSSRSSLFSKNNFNHPYQTRPLSVNITKHDKIYSTVQNGAKLRPSSLSLKTTKSRSTHSLGHIELKESDFFALQATLQTEARIALAQAKEMARLQMERERRGRGVSPVTEMLRRSMEKANAPLAPDRRRVSRQLLTDMNVAQLQVVVNELHSQIESLNESLVTLLMQRDELHMGQDSMLVDIEDLTRYLGVKEQTKKTKGTSKTGVRRLTSLVHK